jgi:hypothetical protein
VRLWREVLPIGICLGVMVSACAKEEEVPQVKPTPIELGTVGAISGEIHYSGPLPTPKRLPLAGFEGCLAKKSETSYDNDLLVNGGRLRNALVYIQEGLGNRVFAIPSTPVSINQQGCMFQPRVVDLQTYQPAVFLNGDPLLHNVRSEPKNSKPFNFGMSGQGARVTKRFTRSEVVIPITCDVHPWMKGYVAVLDHPYHSLTKEDGTFSIVNLPPGEYLLGVWHERLGTLSQKVSVGSKETKKVVLTFSPR